MTQQDLSQLFEEALRGNYSAAERLAASLVEGGEIGKYVPWLQQLAAQGNPEAKALAAYFELLSDPINLDRNNVQRIAKTLLEAFEQGSTNSALYSASIGTAATDGRLTDAHRPLLEAASKQGNVHASMLLASDWQKQGYEGVAFFYGLMAIKQGNTEAILACLTTLIRGLPEETDRSIGDLYFMQIFGQAGGGCNVSRYAAWEIVHKVSLSNFTPAAINLIDAFRKSDQPLTWLKEAAEAADKGLLEQCAAECLYAYALAIKDHDKKAHGEWFVKAANAGHDEAAFRVGKALLRSDDKSEAFRYIKHAAESGSVDAMLMMGLFIASEEFPGSLDEAEYWLEQAACRGNAEAAEMLAELRA